MTVIPRTDVIDTYVVVSGPNTYNVDLRNPFEPSCDCADFIYRERICRHLKLVMDTRDGETE